MYLKAKIKTRAKKEELKEISEDCFEISVKEKPEGNLANRRVIRLIAGHFGVSAGRVRIVNGHHHPHKLMIVEKN
jgi:uncharacterized protein YggU (UPF0235/DUF167 family)